MKHLTTEEKENTLKKIISRDMVVYMVDTDTFDLIQCEVTSVGEGEYVCEGNVPEKYHSVFRGNKFKLKWNEHRKCLHHPDLKHYGVLMSPYDFGYNELSAISIRKRLISNLIAEKYTEVENLILLKTKYEATYK